MSKITFKLDYDGVRENILNSDFMLKECEKYAQDEASKSYGNEWHMKSFKGTQRCHAMAFPNTKENPG